MGIRDFLNRMKEKRLRYKQFAEEMKVQEDYYERKKSANERELERYMNEAREKKIKEELEEWRKASKEENQYGHQILNVKNMFEKEKPEILNNDKIFSNNDNLFVKKGGLFFK